MKGKTKGKSKGKDAKGKTKGKDQKGKGKSNSTQGQWSSSSSTSWSQPSKSGGKGDSKSYDDKGKGKGKKESLLCFNCGRPGHVAKDCWRIRQVGTSETATVVTSVNGQESVGPSASQVQTSLAVKRVAMAQGSGQVQSPVVFDLRSPGLSDGGQVRMVKFFYIDDELEEPTSLKRTTLVDTGQNYEIDSKEVDIIIDSGADAPIFPASMFHCGEAHEGQPLALQDAQGRQIPVLGQKTVAVLLEDSGGVEIELRDDVVFSHEINQPILSYGRLMNAGWSICAETRSLKNGSYEIPIEFQNNSLVVKGHVRKVCAAQMQSEL